MQKSISIFRPPNLPGILNNYTPPKPPTSTVNGDSTTFDLRVDQYIHESDHVSVVVHYFGSFGNRQSILPEQISYDSFRQPNYDFANRLNWDHTFRPNLLNMARNSLTLGPPPQGSA